MRCTTPRGESATAMPPSGSTASPCGSPNPEATTREAPVPEGVNCTSATVVDIGYLGGVSTYKLRIRDGSLVRAAVANVGGTERPIGFDEQVWLSFSPEAATVLTY